MIKTSIKYLSIVIILLLVGLVIIILNPKNYDTPTFQQRAKTKYWELSTGSKIGYSLLNAKGLKKKFPIVFLQGGPGAPIFDSNIKLLSAFSNEGYDVYLYDLVGCGHSNRLKNINEYTVERHVKDLEEIINNIGSEKVIFIAQSWGAILATNYLLENTNKVDRIIYTSPGPILPINYNLENNNSPDSLDLKKPIFTNAQGNKKAYNLKAYIAKYFAEILGLKLVSDNEMDKFASYLNYELSKSTLVDPTKVKYRSGYGYYASVKTVQSFENIIDRRDELSKMETPIIVLKGQYDGIKWGYTEEYLRLFKNHELVIIPDAGHTLTEQPRLYIKTITEFLKKNK